MSVEKNRPLLEVIDDKNRHSDERKREDSDSSLQCCASFGVDSAVAGKAETVPSQEGSVPSSPVLSDHLRPILVGYAFGPKKMSTMGIIMAEASKAVSTFMSAADPVAAWPEELCGNSNLERQRKPSLQPSSEKSVIDNIKRQKLGSVLPSTLSSGSQSADLDVSEECSLGDLSIGVDNDGVDHANTNEDGLVHKVRKNPCSLTSAALEERVTKFEDDRTIWDESPACEEEYEKASSYTSVYSRPSTVSQNFPSRTTLDRKTRGSEECTFSSSVSFLGTEEHGVNGIRFSIAGGPGGVVGLRNIVRLFRSSCSSASSVADSSTTATATTAPLPPSSSTSSVVTPMKGLPMTCGIDIKRKQTPNKQFLQPIRVSFVPLDLDSPLEEQHGGNFDAILHKLTEDILCLSKLSFWGRFSWDRQHKGEQCSEEDIVAEPVYAMKSLDESQSHAVRRVERLNKYKLDHPSCCLIDHPLHIQALMSRSDIANILSENLVNVTTKSGIPVGTPQFLVYDSKFVSGNSGNALERLAEKIDSSPFNYPLIAKPLTAAGTSESHRMVVVLGRDGLCGVQMPSLLQEYANHDGTLYKVYVLGDTVRVFSRPSLPNLPYGESLRESMVKTGFVEFDSQRPYPALSDFVAEEKFRDNMERAVRSFRSVEFISFACEETVNDDGSRSRGSTRRKKQRLETNLKLNECMGQERGKRQNGNSLITLVTVDEIRPVVTVLRKAFNLELFGFDVLVTRGSISDQDDGSGQLEMLVVDVNYFPSYKEVSNFPSLLAQYLTERAIEGRMKSIDTR